MVRIEVIFALLSWSQRTVWVSFLLLCQRPGKVRTFDPVTSQVSCNPGTKPLMHKLFVVAGVSAAFLGIVIIGDGLGWVHRDGFCGLRKHLSIIFLTVAAHEVWNLSAQIHLFCLQNFPESRARSMAETVKRIHPEHRIPCLALSLKGPFL